MALKRRLGISYKAAWRMNQKVMQTMMERDDAKPLSGFIELDDAYIGGERAGTPGRGAANKTPFVVAVQTTAQGQPEAIKFKMVDGFRSKTIESWAKKALKPGSIIISDAFNQSQRRNAYTIQSFAAVGEHLLKSQSFIGLGKQ